MPDTPELDLAAIRFVLQAANADDLIAAAHATIDRDITTPSLIAVISTDHPVMADVGPLFLKAYQDLGKQLPSLPDATHQAIKQYMERIASDAKGCFGVLSVLIQDLEPTGQVHVDREANENDPYDLDLFVLAHYCYDEIASGAGSLVVDGEECKSGLHAHEALMVTLAKDWLAEHALQIK